MFIMSKKPSEQQSRTSLCFTCTVCKTQAYLYATIQMEMTSPTSTEGWTESRQLLAVTHKCWTESRYVLAVTHCWLSLTACCHPLLAVTHKIKTTACCHSQNQDDCWLSLIHDKQNQDTCWLSLIHDERHSYTEHSSTRQAQQGVQQLHDIEQAASANTGTQKNIIFSHLHLHYLTLCHHYFVILSMLWLFLAAVYFPKTLSMPLYRCDIQVQVLHTLLVPVLEGERKAVHQSL